MKLRLHHDSLRLRLTPAEVAQLRDTGSVESTTHFPTAILHCRLQTSRSVKSVDASFQGTDIHITIPHHDAFHWANSDEVGLEADIPTNATASLHILIEKDFHCLHGKQSNTNEIFYPNPAR